MTNKLNLLKLIGIFTILSGLFSCKKSSNPVPIRSIVGTYQGYYTWWQKGEQFGTVDSTYSIHLDSNSNSILLTLSNAASVPIVKVYNLSLTQKTVGTNYTFYEYLASTYTTNTFYQGHSVDVGVMVSYKLPQNTLSFRYDTSYDGTTVGNSLGANLTKKSK